MEDICTEKHKRVDERLDHHERWLGEHEGKIDKLDRSDASNTVAINNLCKQIADLVSTVKWLIGIIAGPMIAGIIGYVIYLIQKIN